MNDKAARRIEWLAGRLAAPVDIAYVACLRIAFGGMLTWLLFRFIWADIPRQMYIEPAFHFSYRWFEWIEPLPSAGMYVLFYALLVCASCIAVGFCYRIAAWAFFVGWTYFFLIDPAYYMNHFYLVGLLAFLFGLMPAHGALSIDAWMRPGIRSQTIPAWTIWMLRAQIGIAYFYGGVTKLHPDWLSGAVLRTAIESWAIPPSFVEFIGTERIVTAMSYGGAVLDLTIVPGLLWRRTRWFYVVGAGVFHLLNAQLFTIDIFPLMAFCLTLAFFDPSWPRTLVRRLGIGARPQAEQPAPPRSGIPRWLLCGLGVYLVIQAIVPLRHFAYPGDHNWTEEGHLFSWHLMSRVKQGNVVFMATDPATEQNWRIDPDEYLAARQVRWMATDPNLILQFAHFIGERFAAQGYGDVEVRAFSKASLNGRPMQYFVNPEIDLTQIKPWQALEDWLVPLKSDVSMGPSN